MNTHTSKQQSVSTHSTVKGKWMLNPSTVEAHSIELKRFLTVKLAPECKLAIYLTLKEIAICSNSIGKAGGIGLKKTEWVGCQVNPSQRDF